MAPGIRSPAYAGLSVLGYWKRAACIFSRVCAKKKIDTGHAVCYNKIAVRTRILPSYLYGISSVYKRQP